ncbi:FxsA family membrane protein [Streptomyces gobiensis]|uniref:FxsA family membrane protein n=1 Tax=Streptomyces gobiensis TaxID=2875706 RepID=UPI001E39EAC8|nr:FxsA family membrane protein [Streptomyces gobiensis]UGY90318.1 FxsA family protein [Streptomyces gobiensis]
MTTGEPYPYEPPPRQSGSGGPDATPPPPRRSLTRTLVPLGVAAWAVLEIWLLTVVADTAGGLAVFALIIAGFVLGAIAIKRAGRRAWRNLAESLQHGTPHEAARSSRRSRDSGGGNALAMLGGLLLMLPGLVSDAVGLLCLFPPSAALLRRVTDRYFGQGMTEQIRIHRPDGKVVPGEVIRDKDKKGEKD